MIFICAGLGGGTGSGAAPVVAQIAREIGRARDRFRDFAVCLRRKTPRRSGAAKRSRVCSECADAVVCFENDRMGDMVAPKPASIRLSRSPT